MFGIALMCLLAAVIVTFSVRRVSQFISHMIRAGGLLLDKYPTQARHAAWTATFWLIHGRYPTTQEYKDYSRRQIDRLDGQNGECE